MTPGNQGNTLARSLAFLTWLLPATPQWMLSADRVWVGLTPESAFLEWISMASNLVPLAEKRGIAHHFQLETRLGISHEKKLI